MATPVHEDEFAQPEDKSQGEQTITVRADVQDIPVDSYHPKRWQSNITILSCYIANFSDGFQNTLANPTNVIFKKLLGSHGYSSDMKTRISNSLIVGAILGIVVIGYTSDMFSRRGGLLFTSSLVAIGTLMSTLALQIHPSQNMLWYFVVVRGIAGFGVGGEYPPSAAAGLEESDNRRSLRLYLLLARRYWWRIFTTSLAFFLYDFINFPNNIMSSTIISSLVKDNDIRKTAIWQVILAILPVPGVMLGAWLTNSIGRRYTGMLGFAGYMVLGFIIGGTYTKLSQHVAAFVVLYGLLQAFGHMGPGATIGLISSEVFPTAVRGMGYGIATAFGRTGAAVGTECFTPLQDRAGNSSTFYLAGGVAIVGIFAYWLLPESSEIDLEKEDRALEEFLAEKGYRIDKR
ncbi:hypothetical protein PENDEC_c031G00654 [Penicillium decumbens]|uniref:Major facilitator superfamily (MFS) profile domain-containing protein n=1 Tax=Penicillium decumbens TaxID=69771 RepID=A0A1V6NVN6_PENDC|nr:hypothetical protein PENDEC_c031G00654 [Penicillium decumbens]